MSQFVPDSGLYNETISYSLRGRGNIPALQQSVNGLVRRHEALRAMFEADQGQPYQGVLAEADLNVGIVDLSHLSMDKREGTARKIIREQASRPFNLGHPPLMRTMLVSLGAEDSLLAITLHHIICDGWSRGVLARELSEFYQSYDRGEGARLPDAILQFPVFARWQTQRIARGDLRHELQYWTEELEGVPSIDLPTDRARPRLQSFSGECCPVSMTQEVTQSVRRLSQAKGVTTFMTLMAAWQILLGRCCGQEELIVGTIVANRANRRLQEVVGLMVNTVALKADLAGNPTFDEFLGKVKDSAIGAYRNQEYPYEKLVAEVMEGRDLSRNPLVEVMFVLEDGSAGQVELEGLTVDEERIETGTAKYDLMLVLKERQGRLEGRIEYNSDIFDKARIERMAQSYSTVLGGAISDADQRIWEIPMLTDLESRKLLTEWNDTAIQHASSLRVHEMFKEQAESTPDRIAVDCSGEQLSYGELNNRANLLANHLRSLGVRRETMVAVCMGRSLELPLALLATLKAGGTCLPLDPGYPRERLNFMMRDSGPVVILTGSSPGEHLHDHPLPVLCLDSEWALSDREGGDRAEGYGDPGDPQDNNLAYVIYTSGSTGTPKGVGIPHGVLANLIEWHNSGLISGARTLQFSSPSFDVSFYEIFTTIVSGGTTIIVPEEFRSNIPGLANFILTSSIEKAVLPVVVLQQLAEEQCFRGERLTSLRELITTGEQLQITRPMIDFFNALTNCSLHNHYGPSESHVVTAYAVAGPPTSWPAHAPIGRPIANTQVYVVDRYMNLSPTGTIGELQIGGTAPGRGYLNRPDLTAERFIPNQFSEQAGQRLYQTGDLVRHLVDGNIEFLGRRDHQVKIRGLRVELGEIEAALHGHPAVREAVVVVRERAGARRLLAYVAVYRSETVTVDQLSGYLKEKLPTPMVPSRFILMDGLPMTSNGKVDRAALSARFQVPAEEQTEMIQARTPAEELVARIWSEVLEVGCVGINRNFFDLGGHSLLASKIILRLREIFRVELSVRSMFENPTVDGAVNEMSRMWGGREMVEEIAWTFLQLEGVTEEDVDKIKALNGYEFDAQ